MTEDALPVVTLAILAKQKATVLPLYLRCIEALDYPKARMNLYVRTNDNTDDTEALLEAWLARTGSQYNSVFYNNDSCDPVLRTIGVHDWEDRRRFTVLNRLREESVQYAIGIESDFYFVADCDNWLLPHTLRALVALNFPVVAPFLRHNDLVRLYSNFHNKVTADGWYEHDPGYAPIWRQEVRGLIEVECVHCTYLVRWDVLPKVYYEDPDYPKRGNRYDYVVFSEAMRKQGIPQFLDNREIYGWLTLDEQVGEAEKWWVDGAIARGYK